MPPPRPPALPVAQLQPVLAYAACALAACLLALVSASPAAAALLGGDDSGTATATATGTCATRPHLKNTGLMACANLALHLHAPSAEACCALCAARSGCAAWTYAAASKPAHCNLKSASDCPRVLKRGSTSGVLVPTPAPAPYTPPHPTPARARNVLFLAVDDMRPNQGG